MLFLLYLYCYCSGCGDFTVADVSCLPDPCPLPDHTKRRSLNELDRKVYAPMSGVGGLVYDKDAIYIDTGNSQNSNANQVFHSPKQLISHVLCMVVGYCLSVSDWKRDCC